MNPKVAATTSCSFLIVVFAAAQCASAAGVKADFNKDGWGDLAIGVSFETVNGKHGAGAVNIIYGSSSGLTGTSSQFLSLDSPGCPWGAVADDRYAYDLAVGDFNNDGYSDLAVGVPFRDTGGYISAGTVHVFKGSPNGLTCALSQVWNQTFLAGSALQEDARFGTSVAAGNFNGDAYSDLAIGAPGDQTASGTKSGSVTIIYGSASGLISSGAQLWSRDSPGINGVDGEGDRFGVSLAAGNFGKTLHGDIAIGIPGAKVGTVPGAGAVTVIYGSSTGLTANGNQVWTQDTGGIAANATEDDGFGYSLAAGNFGKSAQADLAIGVRYENQRSGAVHVLYGSSTGLTATGSQLWLGETPLECFGCSLAAAEFGRSTHADLAIGVPGDYVAGLRAGSVMVLFGSSSGLSLTNAQSLNMGPSAASENSFGANLGTANFGESSHFDLAVGVPGRNVGAAPRAGTVAVFYGSSTGFVTPFQLWSQDSAGVPDQAEFQDLFGFALVP